jgi:hypothetical protein
LHQDLSQSSDAFRSPNEPPKMIDWESRLAGEGSERSYAWIFDRRTLAATGTLQRQPRLRQEKASTWRAFSIDHSIAKTSRRCQLRGGAEYAPGELLAALRLGSLA